MCSLSSVSGSFEEGFLEFYATGARGDKAPSLRDKIGSQLNLCDVQGDLEMFWKLGLQCNRPARLCAES